MLRAHRPRRRRPLRQDGAHRHRIRRHALIAETYDILTSVCGLSAAAIGDVFAAWNATELESYLIEITAIVLRKRDATGDALVDAILDEAEQKGTGRWTAQSALDLGVPVTAITDAVYARALSARRDLRLRVAEAFQRPAQAPLAASRSDLEAIRRALYAAKIVSYAQGFELMSAASELYGWGLNLGEIAAIWRGGCIIRARMLDRIVQAYAADPPPANLLLAEAFRNVVAAAESDWRRVVALSAERGIATPTFSSTLAYYDGLRRARGSANLLQGLRDYFGARTYRRLDKPGVFHTRWGQGGEKVDVG